MGRPITRLPTSVVSHLRSSTILSNVAQIAEELVCNSLDAGATQIQIAVDGEACHMKVDDDGCGISREDLALVGERYATSKLHRLDELEGGVSTLGFRGEALSSLSDLALVEITSRCRGAPNTYHKILKGSATVSIGLCGEERTYGTTVIVRDIFYNQPVRRRLFNISRKKILQSVKESVLRILLIHPHVSFIVRDLARKELVLHTKSAATLSNTLLDMFGEELFGRLQEIDYARGHLRLTGFLSKTTRSHSSKALQYLYINRRFVLKTTIHKLLNSWVGPNSSSHVGKGKDIVDKRLHAGKNGEAEGRKTLRPMFVLNMTCPLSDYDITFEASKTLVEFKDWMSVVSFVSCVLQMIWGDHPGSREEDVLQGPGDSQVSQQKTTKKDNVGQPTKSKHLACLNEDVLPMVGHRALVQSYSHYSFNSDQDFGLHERAGSLDDTSKHQGTTSRKLFLSSHTSGRSSTRTPSFDIDTETKPLVNNEESFQMHYDSRSGDTSLPKRSSCMTPGMQQIMFDDLVDKCIPTVLTSDVLSKHGEYLSRVSKEQLPLSMDTVFREPFCSKEMDMFMKENDKYSNSSFPSERGLRSKGSSPIDVEEESPLRCSRHSQRLELDASFTLDDDSHHFCPVKDIDDEQGEGWLEPGNYKLESSLWSGSEDSCNIPLSPSPSDFLSEVQSYCVEDVSREIYSPDVRCADVDTDNCGSETRWGLRTQTKWRRLKYINGSDCDGINGPAQSDSFHPDWSKSLGIVQIKEPNLDRWKLKAEEADLVRHLQYAGKSDFQKNYDDMHSPPTNDRYLDAVQFDEYDLEVNFYKPRAKRRLDVTFQGSLDKKLQIIYEDSKHDRFNHGLPSEARHPRRSQSGPPLYRPPRRHGIHENPLNSLVTVERLNEGDLRILCTETDSRTEDLLGAVHDKKPTTGVQNLSFDMDCRRDLSKLHRECLDIVSVQLSEPRQECIGQSTPSAEEDVLNKYRQSDEAAAEGFNTVKNVQATPQIEQCKYRSADVDSISGAELPMETVKAMFKEWSNPCMKKDEDVLDISAGVLASSNSSILPGSITKDDLRHARVLRQVDTKFIASVAGGVLLLIDQHAADERVRLEELREDVLGRDALKQSTALRYTQELTITISEQQILQTYHQQIEDWGWRCQMPFMNKSRTSQSARGMCKVLLSMVPCILGVSLTAADLTEYLHQLTDTEGSSVPPPAVIRVLNYKACRGAIMFGDTLLPAECSQLVDQLKGTSLCFQCAHGRPTLVPIVDLPALHKRLALFFAKTRRGGNVDFDDTGLKTVAKAGQWHGLQAGVRPTLERARARRGHG